MIPKIMPFYYKFYNHYTYSPKKGIKILGYDRINILPNISWVTVLYTLTIKIGGFSKMKNKKISITVFSGRSLPSLQHASIGY